MPRISVKDSYDIKQMVNRAITESYWNVHEYSGLFHFSPFCLFTRYLFTLELPEYWENKQADQTLEVLMSDLDPAVMDQFYMKDGVSANDVTRVSTLGGFFPLY